MDRLFYLFVHWWTFGLSSTLVTVKTVAMNICVQVSEWLGVFHSLEYILRGGVHSVEMRRELPNFQSGPPVTLSHQQCEGSGFSTPSPMHVPHFFTLVVVKWYLIISLMTQDGKYLSIVCLWRNVCVSFVPFQLGYLLVVRVSILGAGLLSDRWFADTFFHSVGSPFTPSMGFWSLFQLFFLCCLCFWWCVL